MGVSTWLLEDTQPTLRDYFAAAALQGMLAEDAGAYAFEHLATACYEMADAMLKAREVQ